MRLRSLLFSLLSLPALLPAAEPTPAATAAPPIWPTIVRPEPLPILRLRTGEPRTVTLKDAALGPGLQWKKAASSPEGLTVALEGRSLTVTAPEGTAGLFRVAATADSPDGPRTVTALAIVEPVPLIRFEYRPPAGKSPAKVALAGSFNGWSQDRDQFQRGEDGVWRLEKPISPGNWTYKFVVDGEWIADPANPEQDSSGFGNSLLKVAGEPGRFFDFTFLGRRSPGGSPRGAAFALLPPGDQIDPATVSVVVNNQLLPAEAIKIDLERGTIRWIPPAEHWHAENFVALSAESRAGRRGAEVFYVTTPGAPRSPRDEVIYFPMTDRFRDGDPARNRPANHPELHPLANYHGGDFAGIRAAIEEGYFDKLGVTTLWLSPVNQNTQNVERETIEPGRLFTSYHGYWPTSLTETNEQFGSMDDLRALIASGHSHGIAFLLDFVSNHVHRDHPIYRENPDWKTDYILPDGRPNLRLFDEHPFTTWFDDFLPTLAYDNNDEINTIMAENAVWWLRQTDADGFRHDAVKHVALRFWQQLTETLDREFRDKGRSVYQVGETIAGHATVAQFVGPHLLTGQFDFPLYFTIQQVLARETNPMSELADTLLQSRRYYPPGAIMSPLIGNHDVPRFMALADGDIPPGASEKEIGYNNPPQVDHPASWGRLELAFAFLFAAPGAPMVYYGDEIGMTGAGDPDNRRPMSWSQRDENQDRIFQTVCAISHARRGSVALRRGNIQVLASTAEHLVLAHVAPTETVITAFARRSSGGDLVISLPEYLGPAARIEPLAVSNAFKAATLNGSRLRLPAADHAWGYWRLAGE